MKSKMVIIWRNDLKVRKGKLGSQIAHASTKLILDLMNKYYYSEEFKESLNKNDTWKYCEYSLKFSNESLLNNWINGIFTKICVKVNSKQELLKIYNEAKLNNLPCSIIEDIGLTEFNRNKTLTCCAILGWEEDVNKITGNLELL